MDQSHFFLGEEVVQVTKWSLDSMLMKTVCVPGPSGGWELGLPGSGSLVCRGGDGEEVTGPRDTSRLKLLSE